MLPSVIPLSVGIALSPAVVLAAVMMLLSAHPRAASGGLVIGWGAAIIVSVTAFAVLTSTVWAIDERSGAIAQGIATIAVGVVLLALAVVEALIRLRRGAPRTVPKWLLAIDRLNSVQAVALGFGLLIVNPKNVALAAGAGLAIGASSTAAHAVAGVSLFTAIAVSTVALPVLAYAILGDRLAAPLAALRTWIVRHADTVVATVMLGLGASMVIGGIQGL